MLAPGVVHRAIPTTAGAGIDLVDLDLARSKWRFAIETCEIALSNGRVVGQAYTPHEWLTRTHAFMAVNGGYFGAEDGAGRKEFVGLLVQKGRVRHAAPPLSGSGSATIRKGQYVRSAFGLGPDGTPIIRWAATEPSRPQAVRSYAGPMRSESAPWAAWNAVGCGPTLISQGKIVVTQYQERLVSPGPEPRTFVAYDRVNGQPKHLVVGIASGSDFGRLAAFLSRYFPKYDGTTADDAMCLDGGASTQMTYTLNGVTQSPRETGVTVPDALVLLPKG
jgi:exopolysaccharide biosynthesis protein